MDCVKDFLHFIASNMRCIIDTLKPTYTERLEFSNEKKYFIP